GDALERAREVDDVDDALERVTDPPVDEEVDVDRGVVLGNRGLAGDLDELLADVDLHRSVDDRDEEPEPGIPDHLLVRLAEPEDDHLLVLLNDPDREVDRDQHDDEEEGDDCDDNGVHGTLPCCQTGDDCRSRSTSTVSPSCATTLTRSPRPIGRPSTARALHSSPPAEIEPSGSIGRRTIPGIPGSSATPTRPGPATIRRVRIVVNMMSPLKAAAVAVITTSIGRATLTAGPNGSPGRVYNVEAPRTKQTTPPAPSRPWLVTAISSPNRTIPRPTRR